MKEKLFMIGSDIHGSLKYANMFFDQVQKRNPDQILLLGDLYYNGARNIPPEEYSPREVVTLLNSYADKIIAVKGNCESEVDQMVSQFIINETATVYAFGKRMTLAHGHHLGFENHPASLKGILFQGHTHVSVLEGKEGLIYANPGSISIPKDGHHSYMVLDEKGISLFDLVDGTLLKRLEFTE